MYVNANRGRTFATLPRPRVRRLLGRLEGMEVPMEDLEGKHRELLQNLQHTVEEYDDAFEKLGEGDIESVDERCSALRKLW